MHKNYLIGPHQVSFDITNKCNLRCLHCYNSSGENFQSQNELSDEEVLCFIDEFKDIKLLNFCFCGGEPLLRKELIIKAIEKLKKYQCENIAMVSNGFFLTEETLDRLIAAGLTRIQISLDGACAASHNHLRNHPMAYEKAIAAIKLISKKDIESSVAFTPTTLNIRELPEVKKFLLDLGLKSTLRVQPVMIMGRAAENVSSIVPTRTQYRELVNTIRELNAEDETITINWGDPIDHLIRFTKRDLMITNVVIRSNGEVIVDPYLPIVLGDLRRHSFMEYWNSGLNDVWNMPIVNKLASAILSVDEMDISENPYVPDIFKEQDVCVDLIDTPKDEFVKLLDSFAFYSERGNEK